MTHPSLRQFLLTPPQDWAQARTFGLPLALMAWQLDGQGRLTHAPLPPQAQGGLMLVGASPDLSPAADPRPGAREILAQCRSRGFAGVVLDLEQPPTPYLAQLIRLVEEGLAQRQGALFLPETYANFSRRAGLYLTSALSGGSLRRRLEEAVAQYGARRLVLCLRRAREDFYLPAAKGVGHPISQGELERLRRQLEPSVFFSHELCARYFTYMSRETGAHFVLFDDSDTLARKLQVARELEIRTVLAFWQEIADSAQALGLTRPPAGQIRR